MSGVYPNNIVTELISDNNDSSENINNGLKINQTLLIIVSVTFYLIGEFR